MASNLTVIERKSHQNARRPENSATRWVSVVLAGSLLLVGLLGLYEVAQMRQASSNVGNPSQSIQTIRHFYAGLNEYMETGEHAVVAQTLAPGALAFVPDQGAMGDDSQLLTWLLALRSTYPQLRFTVGQIDTGDEIAIASVQRSGVHNAPDTNGLQTPGASQEFFRVRDGRIVQHWTMSPGGALVHPLTVPPITVERTQQGHLAVAEITFAPDEEESHLVDGPALLVIQSGRLTLTGDGVSQILDIATGHTTVPGPNETAYAEPGQAIAVPASQAHLQNTSSDPAVVRIATLVEDARLRLASYPADRPLPPLAINDLSVMRSARPTVSGSATIRPLAFDERPVPTGRWEVEIGWAVLGPGASLPNPDGDTRTLAHVISTSTSSPSAALDGSSGSPIAMTNTEATPITVLMMHLRPGR